MAYSMEIQTLNERLESLEDLRMPFKIDQSLDPLDHCITFDQRTNTNLRADTATDNNQ